VPTCREVTARERRSQSRFDVQERAFKRACAKKGGKVRIADGQERCVTPAKVIIIVLVLP
jgi:hypothetical protein